MDCFEGFYLQGLVFTVNYYVITYHDICTVNITTERFKLSILNLKKKHTTMISLNDNIVRHRILKVLSEKLVENDVAHVNGENSGTWAVSFKEISEKTKCSELKIRQAVSVLLYNKEVFLNNVEFNGLGAEEAGLSALSTNKYLNLNKSNILNFIKDIVQILIPIISMVIAFVAVSNKDNGKIDKLETKLQEMQISLTNTEEYIKKLQDNTLKATNLSFEGDSLKIK